MTETTHVDTYPHEHVGAETSPPGQPTPEEVEEGRAIVERERGRGGETPDRERTRPWRLARALERVRSEADACNPRRDRGSDGTIGDAAHASRQSDHNPWVVVGATGVVRAIDLDVNGLDLPGAFERLRAAARAVRMPQVTGGGYAIFNRRITAPDWSGWRSYTGSNPHTSHGHISLSRTAAGFDSAAPWGIFGGKPPPPPDTGRTLRPGSTGPLVAALQTRLRTQYPLYAQGLATDGVYGPKTEAAVREFQRRAGLVVDGIAGPITLARLGL